jgi:hypothetical protein
MSGSADKKILLIRYDPQWEWGPLSEIRICFFQGKDYLQSRVFRCSLGKSSVLNGEFVGSSKDRG